MGTILTRNYDNYDNFNKIQSKLNLKYKTIGSTIIINITFMYSYTIGQLLKIYNFYQAN